MTFVPSNFPVGFDVQGNVLSGAAYSLDRHYRYVLWRVWDNKRPPLLWCMLNPSTAGHEKDDATIRKVRGFSDRAGFGGLVVVNLFALRSRYPSVLLESTRPVGPQNQMAHELVLKKLKPLSMVCGWGAAGTGYLGRLVASRAVEFPLFVQRTCPVELTCFGTTKDGQPKHPLTLGYATGRVLWTPPIQDILTEHVNEVVNPVRQKKTKKGADNARD